VRRQFRVDDYDYDDNPYNAPAAQPAQLSLDSSRDDYVVAVR
jgi:hypothetical protein